MRRFSVIAAAFALLLSVAPASAQRVTTIGKECPYEVRFSPTGEQDGAEASYLFRDLRGGIGLFYFFRSSNLVSVEGLADIQALYTQYRERGVRFLCVTADSVEKWGEFQQNREIGFFNAHYRNATLLYYILGAYSDPYVVLVDPRGRLAWRGVPDDLLGQRLGDLIEYTKPPLGDQAWQAGRFSRAERLFGQREYGKAYTIVRELFKMSGRGDALHGRAEAFMARCDAAANEWLREAIQLEQDGSIEQAVRIVAEIAVRFEDPDQDDDDNRDYRGRNPQEDAFHQAALVIGRMSGDRNKKKMIREAQNNARGELLNDQAAGFEEDGYYRDAKTLYEQTIEEYEDTNAGKHAKRRLRAIKRDKEIQQKIAAARGLEEGWRWLDIGDHLLTLELTEQARDKYKELVKKHPGTKPAERAAERLMKLPSE